MKASRIIILNMLLLWPLLVVSQQFWLLTTEFWGGPKTGITLVDDSVLYVSTTTGVLKSTDDGNHFEQVLSASSVHTVFASSSGTVFAGGTGKIYFSEDSGITWDSVAINSVYPVKQIIENKYETLFAITGVEDEGDGVFCSEDDGKTWESRNNGLGYLKGCERIAVDKNGRLYLAISDMGPTGNGGLFISETFGLLWEKISIKMDSFSAPVKIKQPTGLSVSPNDSLYLSFYGVAPNFMVQLNLCVSIDDIKAPNSWKAMHVQKNTSWWTDRPLNNIHFSQNGDWYSSYYQLAYIGATYFSETGGNFWNRVDYGLGSSEDGWRHPQQFVEKSSGRIFMIQYLDERIYTTDKSLVTSAKPPVHNSPPIQVFPNPVRAGGKLTVQVPESDVSAEISIYDLTGKILVSRPNSESFNEIKVPEKPGMYIVAAKYQDAVQTEKILVY
ncbi:T9SS type A sorting domain-containing protein [Mariniphaga sp.]|uniref:T9SS type A sorting domain-containing protein n=1 Tax=Mariniphaga sp. TaxID=1954475 RepID=UPI003562D29E